MVQSNCNTQIVRFDKELLFDIFLQAITLILFLICIGALLFIIYSIIKKLFKKYKTKQ